MFRTRYNRDATLTALAITLALAGTTPLQAAAKHHTMVKHHAPTGIKARVAQFPAGIEAPTREIHVSVGQGEIINLPTYAASVWVSNPTAADVYISNPRQIHLFGKGFGETTVFATSASGAVIYSANVVVGQNITSIDRLMHAAMPEANVHVEVIGQVAVMTGTVASHQDVAQAETLVAGLLNGVKKSGDAGALTIINRLKTSMPMQVNLQVRIAEVSRSLLRTIGTNIVTRDTTGGFKFGLSRGGSPGTISGIGNTQNLPLLDPSLRYGYPANTLPLTPFDPASGQFVNAATTFSALTNPSNINRLNLAGHFLGLDILSALDLGEQIGLVTTLSQPNLTALSGETAEFLAGGEIPIPQSQGLGAVSVEFKKYGVSLSYTPTVLSNGLISMRVRPEVSDISTQGAVTLNGFSIPALTVRRAETTIELGSGQSFMIAGLLSNNANHTIEKMPGAGDIPILGSLFRSTSFQKNETELVIVVTPYLVNPVNANDIKLPTDGYQSPNMIQQVLGHMDSDGKTGGDRPKPSLAPSPANNPQIGDADLSAPAMAHNGATPAATAKPSKAKRHSADHSADKGDSTPGFSLN